MEIGNLNCSFNGVQKISVPMRKAKPILLFYLIIMLQAMAVNAQVKMITGTVMDSKSGETIPGVNISILGTSEGTSTDANGKYSLKAVSQKDTLNFTFVGYMPQKIAVAGKGSIDVFLVQEATLLDEVVVTALNINRTKSSLGYSVSAFKADELTRARENNLVNNLAGKVAGLQISKSATGVDGSTRVILRGVASITGDNRPLIVVDGIPVDAGHGGGGRWGGTDGGDALSDINPDDIESMSILKGAGAAAAYGSRGANGVILIITKKGTLKKGLGVTVNSNFSVDQPFLFPEFQNVYGHGAFGTYPTALPDAGMPWAWSYGTKMDGNPLPNFWGGTSPYSPQPNNYKDFFKNGSSFVNSVGIESGNQNSSVRASFTSQKSNGIVPFNGLNRQTINLRGASKVKDVLELDARFTYIHSKSEGRPSVAEDGIPYFLAIMPRNMVSNDLNHYQVNASGFEQLWTSDSYTSNPYWKLYNRVNQDEKHRMQAVFSSKLNFTSKLNLLLRSGLDFTNRMAHDHTAKGSVNAGINGSLSNSAGTDLEWNSDFLLSFNPSKTGDFEYSVSLGGNYRYNTGRGLSQWGNNLRINDYYVISNAGSYGTNQWFSEKQVLSAYGLSTLSFKNWLYLDLTLRNDWSSTLPIANNSYTYHSENLSFLFTEAFHIKSALLTAGKLRSSFSRVGNDTGPYQTSKYFYVNQSQLPYPTGGFSNVLASYNLQPEITASWEAGTNLNFLKGLFILDVTYYRNNSENQIMEVPLPPASGYSSMRMNAAHLKNTGFEVQLDVLPLSSDDFTWKITGTWSKNKSEVVELTNNLESIILDDAWFATIQARPGAEYGEIFTTDFKRDAFGNIMVDDKGFVMKGDYKRMGNINPDWIAGLSNMISYKSFNFSFLIDIRKGGEIYSMGKAYRNLFGTSLASLEGREEWYATHDPAYGYSTPLPGVEPKGYVENGINVNTGQQNTVPIDPIYRFYNIWAKEIGTENICDATNIRMREASIGYSLPKKLLSKIRVTDVQVCVFGRNLFFLYNAMNDVDPESGYSSGNTGGGMEHNAIPSTRSIGLNVKVNF